jgi:hypothetical protein
MKLNDQMNFITVTDGQRVAFKILDVTQTEKPGHQVVGAAFYFLMLCGRFKQDPRVVLDKASHVLYDSFSEGTGEQARAMKMYMEKEL